MKKDDPIRRIIAMEDANVLQDTANKLQEEMIEETRKNSKVTAKQNTVIIWLTLAIVVVGVLAVLSNFYNTTGRYVISSVGGDAAFILDTKTSEMWFRGPGTSVVHLGTNKNPKAEVKEAENKR